MLFSASQLEKFKAIYKNTFDRELSESEAYEKALMVYTMVSITFKPMTRQELENVQRHRERLNLPRLDETLFE